MRPGYLIIAVVLFLLPGIIPVFAPLFSQSSSAQNKSVQVNTHQRAVRPSSRIKGVINGSERPDEIPDNVAIELFLRTVAEGNARGLVKQAGFEEEQADSIMKIAYSLNELLEGTDRKAFELKSKRGTLLNDQLKSDISKVQQRKDGFVEKAVKSWLPHSLGTRGMNKLRNFVKASVKRNVKKIVTSTIGRSGRLALNSSLITPFSPNGRLVSGGELFLYSAGWNDGFNVYGSGSVSEQYWSESTYLVTVTVTSPSGRVNLAASDWSYATVVHDSGLSIGVEDGSYAIEASFEEQGGYYDEYGNFYGSGSYFVGSSTSSTTVAPTISISEAIVSPNTFYLGTNNPEGGEGSGVVKAKITSTVSVPSGTTLEIDFYETSNDGNVAYDVHHKSSSGYKPHPTPDRQIRQEILYPRTIKWFDLFDITIGTTSINTGRVDNRVRINKIIARESPSPTNDGVVGENSESTATFSLLSPTPVPSPTPSSTPTGVAGLCNGSPDFGQYPTTGCASGLVNSGGVCTRSGAFINQCMRFGDYDDFSCTCTGGCQDGGGCSPILIDTLGNGFSMTDAANGVMFDIVGLGMPLKFSWTAANSDDAWLALDRNQNNRIDNGTELFGNVSEQPPGQNPEQGFASLGMFDDLSRGGNADGKITRSDAVFRRLRLWIDKNHNGISEAEELYRLPALDVVAVSLDCIESKRVDEFGNQFKYRAKVRDKANAKVGRWAWDVFLNIEP